MDYKGHNIAFIVGCPRSGTTWLQRLLSCHPKIRTGQESDLFDVYIGPQLKAWRRDSKPNSSGREMIGLCCYFTEEEFLNLLREYMIKLLTPMVATLQPGEIFIEKTPSHALFIPEIIELLPESRIIHIIRDHRDVVASILAASRSWGKNWAPRYAWKAVLMWVRHVKAARDAAKTLSKKQFYEIRYEDLYYSTYQALRQICQFLELEWDDKSLLDAIKINEVGLAKVTGGSPIPASGEFEKKFGVTVKEPNGFIRKGKPGSWREDLSLTDKTQVYFIKWLMEKETFVKFVKKLI